MGHICIEATRRITLSTAIELFYFVRWAMKTTNLLQSGRTRITEAHKRPIRFSHGKEDAQPQSQRYHHDDLWTDHQDAAGRDDDA